ncbi:MAG: hypothetical protein NTV41_00020 [Actinobacteria bacterium]|nr:hypothetical protein [Actinomycetota bacterium]
MIPLYKRASNLFKNRGFSLAGLKANTIELFSKRDLIVISTFAILGIGGAFAATLITVTAPDSQGAGYLAASGCDEEVTINKDVVFNATTKRFEVTTISISDVKQNYDSSGRNGCGNMVMELALPINGGVTYASWTIPSSTITTGSFAFGGATGITYNAYTALSPVDAEILASVAIRTYRATRAVNNGPVYDVLKENGFTTTGQSGSSLTITFALSLSCGVLTVDTTAPGVYDALTALTAPTGYVKNDATSTGANGATTAALLGFRGTVANINIVLPWISYNKSSGTACTSLPVFQGAIWDAQPTGVTTPIAYNFTENGHYYQFLPTTKTWAAAYKDITGLDVPTSGNETATELLSTTRAQSACSFKLFGLCGYFATVQTGLENAFITSKVGTAGAWLGANDRVTRTGTKTFTWSDPVAPEYNKVFSVGTARDGSGWNASTSTTAQSYTVNGTTYRYENWDNNEPNNSGPSGSCGSGCSGEQVIQILAGSTNGYWNDLAEQGGSQNLGYIVEYGDSTASGESLLGGGSKTSAIVWHW